MQQVSTLAHAVTMDGKSETNLPRPGTAQCACNRQEWDRAQLPQRHPPPLQSSVASPGSHLVGMLEKQTFVARH
jgi:hypothetical protein